MTTGYDWTNNSKLTNELELYALGLSSNYALDKDTGNKVTLNNKTLAPDQEVVTFKGAEIAKVDTVATLEKPTLAKAVQYSVRVDNVLKTYDDDVNNALVSDEPVVVQINIRHQKSDTMSKSGAIYVQQALNRAISALFYEENGTLKCRCDDLMRGQERPLVG